MSESDTHPVARVTFSVTDRTVDWDPSYANILEFAEAQGLEPPYSCRAGICNTCMREIVGEVRYIEEPLAEPDPGQALICCSVPDGDISIDL